MQKPTLPLPTGTQERAQLEAAVKMALMEPLLTLAYSVMNAVRAETDTASVTDEDIGKTCGSCANDVVIHLFGNSPEPQPSPFFDLNATLSKAGLAGDIMDHIMEGPQERTCMLQVAGHSEGQLEMQVVFLDRIKLEAMLRQDESFAALLDELAAQYAARHSVIGLVDTEEPASLFGLVDTAEVPINGEVITTTTSAPDATQH